MCFFKHNYSKLSPLVFTILGWAIILYRGFYRQGSMILGGEGSYYTDLKLLFVNYGFTWQNSGTGIFATTVNYLFHLVGVQKIFVNNERLINFVIIYTLYILPFIAIYGLSVKLKLKTHLVWLISLFYIFNPFSSIFLESINQWNMLILYVLPANFLIIYSFYQKPLKLFFVFGIHSIIFAFTNANPPTMAVNQIAIITSLVIAWLIKDKTQSFKKLITKYGIIFGSFFLFNFWWIINWFYIFFDAQANYTKGFVLGWLRGSGDFIPLIWRALTLTGLLQYPVKAEYNFFALHYSYWYVPIILSIPIFIFIYFLFRHSTKIYIRVLTIFILIIVLLVKGTYPPFGDLYKFLVLHLPLFSIFKSATEKWGVLLVFLLTLFIILSLKNKSSKLTTWLLLIYVGYCSIPFITSNFIPEAKINPDLIHTKRFTDKPEYSWLRQKLNKDPEIYRILSLPGSLNYQIALHIKEDKYYTGNDPILTNTNKPFIAPYNGTFDKTFDPLFTEISQDNYLCLLSFFNLKKIILNYDNNPWFGFKEEESLEEIEKILAEKFNLTKEVNGAITVFDIGDNFLPRFYIPKDYLFTDKDIIENLINLVSSNNFNIRTAILADNLKDKITTQTSIPKIAFVKINPTKYKIKVENASTSYTLVFSESFHRGWKLYLDNNNQPNNIFKPIIAEYFGGQIKEGSHKNILFYPEIFETISKKEVGEHFEVNGYANAWQIIPTDTDNQSDYTLIVEYYPQRLFYFGVIITLITIIASLTLLLRNQINGSKTK